MEAVFDETEHLHMSNDPPSSPFLSELVSNSSRSPSRQQSHASRNNSFLDTTSPTKIGKSSASFEQEDKENHPLPDIEPLSVKKRRVAQPEDHHRSSVSEHASLPTNQPGCGIDTDLMPPPSRRSPYKSPLKPQQSTTRPSSRDTDIADGLNLRPKYERPPTRQDSSGIDDTCFSNFSEVPASTLWSRADQTPKPIEHAQGGEALRTPRSSRKRTSPSRSPSPTPRRQKNGQQDTQTYLIDFTQQIEGAAHLPSSRTEPNLLQHLNRQRSPGKSVRQSLATPAKQSSILNLLDFELPPAPTPRSIPTITVRELETLKSQYLGQISNLKATLSGREAEVESLKRAVADSERRVGDAQEALREERARREHAEQEKLDWERRGQEVENVLNNVKEEVLKGEVEKADLLQQLDEHERRAEDADLRANRVEHELQEALKLRHANSAEGAVKYDEDVQRLRDMDVERVTRTLHDQYKEKHQRKIAALKVSYEAKAEKRCAELLNKVSKLERAHDEILLAKETLAAGLDHRPEGNGKLRAEVEQQKAQLARVEEELAASKSQRDELAAALEKERIEKGDLVAAVDEMLALQSEQGPTQQSISVVEDFRKSISRPPSVMTSRMRAPSESRIGRIPQAGRTPAAGKSRMLANIERMGRPALRDQ